MNQELLLHESEAHLDASDSTELWYGDRKLVGRRKLQPSERVALINRTRLVRLGFLVMINVTAAAALSLQALDEWVWPFAALASLACLGWWLYVSRDYRDIADSDVLLFGGIDEHGGANRSTTGNGKFEIRTTDGEVDVERTRPMPRELPVRQKDDLRLSPGELRELASLRKGLESVSWIMLGFFIISAVRLPEALEGDGKSLVYRVTMIVLTSIGFLSQHLSNRSENKRIRRVINDAVLRPNLRGDKLVLSDGVAWTVDGNPAEWRRNGESYPRPEF